MTGRPQILQPFGSSSITGLSHVWVKAFLLQLCQRPRIKACLVPFHEAYSSPTTPPPKSQPLDVTKSMAKGSSKGKLKRNNKGKRAFLLENCSRAGLTTDTSIFTRGAMSPKQMVAPSLSFHTSSKGKKKDPRMAATKRNGHPRDQPLARQRFQPLC